jgi:hypothetical protein
MKILAITVLFLASMRASSGQVLENEEIDIQRILDDLAGSQDHDIPYETLYENLMQVFSEPYDLNKVTEDELRLLGFLSASQVNALIAHRETQGEFISLYELQAIPGFDEVTTSRLSQFVRLEEPSSRMNRSIIRRIADNRNAYFLARYDRILEKKSGFSADGKKFQGSPDHLSARFRSSRPGDFSIGFTVDKDAGEKFLMKPVTQLGFDFSSFHIQLQNKGRMRNLIAGDYQIQAGQGLVLGGLFGLGKSGGEPVNTIRRSNIGGLPFTSSNENGYLRGSLITFEATGKFLVTAFYAQAGRDAALESDTTDGQLITALQLSGLHRTPNEQRARHAVRETNAGMILNYKTHGLDAGVIWNTITFSSPVRRKPTPYNQFAFSGKQSHNLSLFLNYNLGSSALFSEMARSVGGGTAFLAGILTSLTAKFDIAFAYRYFAPDFHTFYSNALSEGSTVQNETGIYWGWKYRIQKHFNFTGYVDLFRFPWLRYRSYAPSAGYEWLLRIRREISKTAHYYAQVREESKARNLSADRTTVYVTGPAVKRNYILGAGIRANPSLTLNTRAQFSTFSINNRTTQGFALMQDIRLDLRKITVSARYVLFDTDDYDNRQYVYEHDAWLSFSMPAYEGVGVRHYIMARFNPGKRLTCWIRFAHTRYTDRENIGSGNDQIAGNQRNDIKFQMRYKF